MDKETVVTNISQEKKMFDYICGLHLVSVLVCWYTIIQWFCFCLVYYRHEMTSDYFGICEIV